MSGGHCLCLEVTACVWRSLLVSGGHCLCLEVTACVWRSLLQYNWRDFVSHCLCELIICPPYRDGPFGACFHVRWGGHPPVLYSARPGGRLWEVGVVCVLVTPSHPTCCV